MKQCPVCKTTYTDETLSFCLTDGAKLVSLPDAAETVRMSFGNDPVRINVPPDSSPTVFTPPISGNPPKKGINPIVVAALVGVLLLFAIGFIGVIGYFSLKSTGNDNIAVSSPTPAAKSTPTPTSDDETAELKEKLANLEKQVRDRKNPKNTSSVETYSTPELSVTTARANSPRDGFLALRSEPDSETGYRIMKIPHGASLTVLGCPKPSNVGKMRGRWCQVIYNGQSGWAFDAFMIF